MPVAFMWDLKISLRSKIGICALMGVGFFTGACAIARTVYMRRLGEQDLTWRAVELIIWAVLEADIGIIAACMPTMKPLFTAVKNPTSGIRQSLRKLTISRSQSGASEDDEQKLSYPSNSSSSDASPDEKSTIAAVKQPSNSQTIMDRSNCDVERNQSTATTPIDHGSPSSKSTNNSTSPVDRPPQVPTKHPKRISSFPSNPTTNIHIQGDVNDISSTNRDVGAKLARSNSRTDQIWRTTEVSLERAKRYMAGREFDESGREGMIGFGRR